MFRERSQHCFWHMVSIQQITAIVLVGAGKCQILSIPVVSVIGSALILHEPVNWITVAAIAAILIGLVFSQKGNEPV